MNTTQDNRIEILSPAGNVESLRAAVVNGADAVYLGTPTFSARAKADNFSFESLKKAVRYCHLFGAKVYLAVNTIIKPEEYVKAIDTVKQAVESKIDAIIVQDLGFLSVLHSNMPDVTVHLSTQTGIHNACGAIIAEKLGAKRIILSRETLLQDIVEIKKATNLEIEYFVHGALCVAFSGNCYFSSLATGCSGNRGKCLQFCRKKYSVGNREGYFLSAKDINESDRIKSLIDSGVTSFKIEGRMRRAEYVGEATRHYKALLTRAVDSTYDLDTLFNRGNGCHAYIDNPTENIIYPNVQGHLGRKIGFIKSIHGNIATLQLDTQLHVGDGIKFIHNGIESGNASVLADGCKTGFEGCVRVGDDVYITSDVELLKQINSRIRKIPINVSFSCAVGNHAFVNVSTNDGLFVSIESDFIVEEAKSAPITNDIVKKCFDKTGETEFILSKFSCEIPKNAFIIKSSLNELRRKAYCSLENKIVDSYESKNKIATNIKSLTSNVFDRDVLKFFCAANNQSKITCKYILDIYNENVIFKSDDSDFIISQSCEFDAAIYSPREYDEHVISRIKAMEDTIHKRVYLDLPLMIRGNDFNIIRSILSSDNIQNVVINNIGELELCKNKNYILGSAMNIVNTNFPARKIMSVEYDGKNFGDNYVYVFGKYPVMTFAHCPKKTLNNGKCLHCNREPIKISDHLNKYDIIFYKVGYCYARLLNCDPICAIDLCKKFDIKRKIIDFVGILPNERNLIIEALHNSERPPIAITRGFFTKKLD